MFGNIGGQPISIGPHSSEFALGDVSKKPKVADDRTEVHKHLSLTVIFLEDITYGATAARFTTRLGELVQNDLVLIE